MNHPRIAHSGGGHGPHVVFVGEGHASLHALVRTAELTARGCAVTLVSPTAFAYSGIAAATLGGRYTPQSPWIDAGRAVLASGSRVVRRRGLSIDASARALHLDDGSRVLWDLLVLDAGSEAGAAAIPGAAERAFPVKPFTALLRYRQALLSRLGARPVHVSVMGGGPSACEVAANTVALARRVGGRAAVTVLTSADRLIEHLPAPAARALLRHLEGLGIRIVTAHAVTSVEAGATVDESGERRPFDLLVDATGLRAVPLAKSAGMPSYDGALLVDRHLRALGDARIFGGGDGVRVRGHEHIPPAGVHAVRQGPVLLHNLLATIDGGRLRSFRPQRRHLLILDLGDAGLAVRNGMHWLGPMSLRLKDRIDMAFLRRHGGSPRRTVEAGMADE